ncbi:type 1 fimbrial protein, partial [Salmonella enterica]|nr:type 1 fimbrial protein [Salmonella enterica]EKI7269156.1 type 1 fimbrial protein [Salmonella enterica]EKI7504530.1 type 1 fimbrial protein [Salmonella enterica]
MSMKKYLAMITGSLLVSSSAMAVSDNTITFQGEVSDETCSVVINGNQAKPVVLLPTVSTKDLSEQGKTAGPITFDIGLSGCTGSK